MSFPQVLTDVAHIGIPTNDLDKTIAFYKKLGFVSALETVNKAAGERVAFLQLGDLMIETYENHRAAEKAGAIDHVALATTDIEAAFAAAKRQGCTCCIPASSHCRSGKTVFAFSWSKARIKRE